MKCRKRRNIFCCLSVLPVGKQWSNIVFIWLDIHWCSAPTAMAHTPVCIACNHEPFSSHIGAIQRYLPKQYGIFIHPICKNDLPTRSAGNVTAGIRTLIGRWSTFLCASVPTLCDRIAYSSWFTIGGCLADFWLIGCWYRHRDELNCFCSYSGWLVRDSCAPFLPSTTIY